MHKVVDLVACTEMNVDKYGNGMVWQMSRHLAMGGAGRGGTSNTAHSFHHDCAVQGWHGQAILLYLLPSSLDAYERWPSLGWHAGPEQEQEK